MPEIRLIFAFDSPECRRFCTRSRLTEHNCLIVGFMQISILIYMQIGKDQAMHEIRFYRASEKPYGVFSNLYKREITFEGEVFATSEHAYQAGKARKPAVKKWLMDAPSPSLLAMAAHGLYYWDVAPGWSKGKFDRMKAVLCAKFTQHEDLKEILLGTGNARLVESATVDNSVNRLWGEVNGVGKNALGIMLMKLRAELRKAQEGGNKSSGSNGNCPTLEVKGEFHSKLNAFEKAA